MDRVVEIDPAVGNNPAERDQDDCCDHDMLRDGTSDSSAHPGIPYHRRQKWASHIDLEIGAVS
jgi:hypothetical protein